MKYQKYFATLFASIQCAIQETNPETVCAVDPRIRLIGGSTFCDIVITRVSPSDYGKWDCLVNEIEQISSDQAQVALEVRNLYQCFICRLFIYFNINVW